MKKITYSLLIMVMGLIIELMSGFMLTGGVQAEPIPSVLEELYKAAKKEGKVGFYCPLAKSDIMKMYNQFNKRFPGIELEQWELSSPQITPRIVTESKLGKFDVDVGHGGEDDIKLLTDRDLLAKYNWSEVFNVPARHMISEGRGVIRATNVYCAVYNTNLVKNPEKFPKSTKQFLESLLEPQWKGKILLDKRAGCFSLLAATSLGDEWMTNYLKKLRAQKPIFCDGVTVAGNMIISGEASIGIAEYIYHLLPLQAKGAPIDWIRISPMGYLARYLYVLKNAPHPNTARLWAGWFCSREGLKLWEEITGAGFALPGVDSNEARLLAKEGIALETVNTMEDLLKYDGYREKYAKILAGR